MTLNESLELRLTRLRAARLRAGALLISNLANVRYLTGFTGSAGLVIVTGSKAFFITDSRYGADALGDAGRMYETVILKGSPEKTAARICRRLKVGKLAFEKTASYAFYERLRRAFGADVAPLAGVVEGLRQAKDDYEINCIRGAVSRAEEAFRQVRGLLKLGVSEKALAVRLEEAILRQGSMKPAFPAIVASGENSAVPHARPTERKFQPGDLVVVDWGAEYEGYCSDMTRTFLIKGQKASSGKDSRLAEKRRIYRIVLEAQAAAISFVQRKYRKPGGEGKGAKDIDNSARYVIKQAGYGEYFGHSLGHGVGLEVHEQPGISPYRRGGGALGGKPLVPKTVFTVEPGIYVPGLGGVRIEDMVFLADPRPEVLTHLPKAGI